MPKHSTAGKAPGSDPQPGRYAGLPANTWAARQPFLHRHPLGRFALHRGRLLIALLCAIALVWGGTDALFAQTPSTFRIFPRPVEQAASPDGDIAQAAGFDESAPPKRIIIDTDPGVDDAAALAWALLARDQYNLDILGIVATAGNADQTNATRNALIVRQLAGATDVPLYMGESKPLVQRLSSTGLLIHGIDGLWSAGGTYPQNLNQATRQAWRFYCSVGREQPGATIVALGPLTNVARAIRSCRNDMRNFEEIIVLGGAKFGGNTTPIAEFNIWQDPEAAELVLNSGIDITLIPQDTFTTLQFTYIDLLLLAASDQPAAQLLACPLGFCPVDFVGEILEEFGYESLDQLFADLATNPALGFEVFLAVAESPLALSPLGLYLGTQLQAVGEASIPDIGAMLYAVDPSLGTATTALVKVELRPESVRGQTVIGLSVPERVTMIVDDRELSRIAQAAYNPPLNLGGVLIPNPLFLDDAIAAILAREPDNVTLVTGLEVELMRGLFLATLTAPVAASAGLEGIHVNNLPATLPGISGNLFVPTVMTDGGNDDESSQQPPNGEPTNGEPTNGDEPNGDSEEDVNGDDPTDESDNQEPGIEDPAPQEPDEQEPGDQEPVNGDTPDSDAPDSDTPDENGSEPDDTSPEDETGEDEAGEDDSSVEPNPGDAP